jgi:mannose/fructose/N-acetylgalactosamine-specific phosphotransferase system component IID
MNSSGRRAHLATFFRSFLIQGSWNNRTMIGSGFAFAMIPVLRRVFKDDEEGFAEALHRHSEHFNSHPYFSNLALGATTRMEEDGRNPEEIRRFKQAATGPLGGLGDALIWVGWRPATVLCALVLALAGAPPWATAVFFLVLYNTGHLLLRAWGFSVGLDRGSQVGDSLRNRGLSRLSDRLAATGVFLLGGLLGLAFGTIWEDMNWPLVLLSVTGGVWGVWLGSLVGQRGWRWTYWGVSAAIGIIFLVGWIA